MLGKTTTQLICNKLFENVSKSKYLGPTVMKQNWMYEEIKGKRNSENVNHHSVQNLLPSRSLPKNMKIKIQISLISPDVLYGCEKWSFTLGKEYKLRVFMNRVLRKIFETKREELRG